MRVSEIKKAVYSALLSSPQPDIIDSLILSCILYDYVKRIVASEDGLSNDISSLASKYLPSIERNLAAFKRSFVAYTEMRAEVESFGNQSFLQFTPTQIAVVTRLYQDRTKSVDFSTSYFSQYMYKVVSLKERDYRRLTSIHRSVMSPIASYYTRKLGKSDSDLEVFTALVYPGKPGREILFSVRGVEPSRVVSDVKSLRIPIRGSERNPENYDYYDIKVEGKYVRIVTK